MHSSLLFDVCHARHRSSARRVHVHSCSIGFAILPQSSAHASAGLRESCGDACEYQLGSSPGQRVFSDQNRGWHFADACGPHPWQPWCSVDASARLHESSGHAYAHQLGSSQGQFNGPRTTHLPHEDVIPAPVSPTFEQDRRSAKNGKLATLAAADCKVAYELNLMLWGSSKNTRPAGALPKRTNGSEAERAPTSLPNDLQIEKKFPIVVVFPLRSLSRAK